MRGARSQSSPRQTAEKYSQDLSCFAFNNLKFDASDPVLGSNHGELSFIFALMTDENVESNLRADHGLHELVKHWLLDSTVPASVN